MSDTNPTTLLEYFENHPERLVKDPERYIENLDGSYMTGLSYDSKNITPDVCRRCFVAAVNYLTIREKVENALIAEGFVTVEDKYEVDFKGNKRIYDGAYTRFLKVKGLEGIIELAKKYNL